MQTRWKSGVDAAKLDDLRRMQRIALALLLTMAALLAATSFTIAAHPWTAWLKAFAEAAVVGAVADWFAVVALFRHPLGLPIAHTAIIPNNKDRIGESLGRFVEENFLTPENVMQRLARVNIAKAGGTWLAEPANSDRTAGGICAMVPRVLTMIPGRGRGAVPHAHAAGRAREDQSLRGRRRSARACYLRRAVPGPVRRCARRASND